jgi:hypothetical protein
MAEREAGWVQPHGFVPPHFTPPYAPLPPRPVYREPHPISAAAVLAGVGATLLWFALFGSLARDLLHYAWWTTVAAVCAWVVALVLTVVGDRGVAVGVALAGGFAWCVAAGFVAERWITTSDWPMW